MRARYQLDKIYANTKQGCLFEFQIMLLFYFHLFLFYSLIAGRSIGCGQGVSATRHYTLYPRLYRIQSPAISRKYPAQHIPIYLYSIPYNILQ